MNSKRNKLFYELKKAIDIYQEAMTIRDYKKAIKFLRDNNLYLGLCYYVDRHCTKSLEKVLSHFGFAPYSYMCDAPNDCSCPTTKDLNTILKKRIEIVLMFIDYLYNNTSKSRLRKLISKLYDCNKKDNS